MAVHIFQIIIPKFKTSDIYLNGYKQQYFNVPNKNEKKVPRYLNEYL